MWLKLKQKVTILNIKTAYQIMQNINYYKLIFLKFEKEITKKLCVNIFNENKNINKCMNIVWDMDND